jgi:hypothetical protein
MTHPRHLRLAFLASFLCAIGLFAQGAYKTETIGPPTGPELSQATRQALGPQGIRLLNDQGAPLVDIWLRKSIPTRNAAGASDILYPGMVEGTMLGVADFPSGGSDFRGQAIKPGYYTLRYALMPQDGNHMGVSPNRDFLLLTPAAVDTDIDKPLPFDALVKLSRQASGTGHPAILSLSPATGNKPPSAYKDDQGHVVLQLEIPAVGQRGFPMGIILVGKSEAA